MRPGVAATLALTLALALALTACARTAPPDGATSDAATVPSTGGVDYQLGGDGPLDPDVGLVVRDWWEGQPAGDDVTSLCYLNAFQSQPADPGSGRLDTADAWPDDLLLTHLGADPGWPGEVLVDLRDADRRARAVDHLTPALVACADAGFVGVELDNLDSWTRFAGTGRADQVPFGEDEAVAYAAALVEVAHGLGLAVAQKNTLELSATASRDTIGFDLLVVEECGAFGECDRAAEVFGDQVVAVEYTDAGLAAACASSLPSRLVVQRDLDLVPEGEPGHLRRTCADLVVPDVAG